MDMSRIGEEAGRRLIRALAVCLMIGYGLGALVMWAVMR